jgi:hypothetical protein
LNLSVAVSTVRSIPNMNINSSHPCIDRAQDETSALRRYVGGTRSSLGQLYFSHDGKSNTGNATELKLAATHSIPSRRPCMKRDGRRCGLRTRQWLKLAAHLPDHNVFRLNAACKHTSISTIRLRDLACITCFSSARQQITALLKPSSSNRSDMTSVSTEPSTLLSYHPLAADASQETESAKGREVFSLAETESTEDIRSRFRDAGVAHLRYLPIDCRHCHG